MACQEDKKLRPSTDEQFVRTILDKNYNMNVSKIKELNGYDDRNYYVIASSKSDGSSQQELILKITNSSDSKQRDLIDASNDLILHVVRDGINTTIPLRNVNNEYVSYEMIKSENQNQNELCAVRLLTFLPGKILCHVEYTPNLLFECGVLLAKLTNSLEKYTGPYLDVFKSRNFTWSMMNLPKLREYLYLIKNEDKIIVENTINQFEQNVLNQRDKFKSALIHGDMNEQNIIVNQVDNKWHVNGVIDFGDVHFAPQIFDVSLLAMYTMLDCKSIDPIVAPGHVLSGYLSLRQLDKHELDIVPICLKARLCQSLVLGAYSISLEPNNTYVTKTAINGWSILNKLAKLKDEELLVKWKNVYQMTHDI